MIFESHQTKENAEIEAFSPYLFPHESKCTFLKLKLRRSAIEFL